MRIKAFIAAASMALMLTSCGENVAAAEPERFTQEFVDIDNMGTCAIITDTETGVRYLFVSHRYSGGLTVLQDD